MKALIFISILLFSLSSMGADCLNQKDEMKQYWARVDGRSQSGGWLFFTGKAASSSTEQAYFKAEGMALSRLVQECRLIHPKTRIIERCDEKVGTSVIAYVRANVTVKECQKSQQQSNSDQNEKFTKIYSEYDKQQRKERMINFKGGNSKLTSLRNSLTNLLRKKRTSSIQQEIEKKKRELNLLESKNKRKSFRCTDAIHCLKKGNNLLKAGKKREAGWTYFDGCYTYKDPELCFSYGIYIKNGPESTTKKYTVYNAFKEACSRNHGEACYELGRWESSQYKDKQIDAKLSYKMACDHNFYKGCVERGGIANYKYQKKGKKKDLDKAEAYFTKACQGIKSAEGCVAAYDRSRHMVFKPAKNLDKKRMKRIKVGLVKYACEKLDHQPACSRVLRAMEGTRYVYDKKTKKSKTVYAKNFKEAIKYTIASCEKGYGPSCGSYAFYLRDYYKKEQESNKLYEKTCDVYKQAYVCDSYASYLANKGKLKKAVLYAERACSNGFSHGCLRWGTMVEEKLKKMDEAATIYKIGCERNNKDSCGRYGLYIADELNDYVKGLGYIKKACWYKNTDPVRDKINYNSNEACVYRAKIEVQKFKRIKKYKRVLKYHCNQKGLRKKAKDMACDLYEEISG